MPSFYKEKNQTWTCMYHIPANDGSMKRMARRGFILKKDAKEWYDSICGSIQDGSFTDAGKLTVAEWLRMWYETHCATLRPNTLASYKNNIDNHIIPAIGAIRLRDLRADHVQRFYNQILKTPIARKEVEKERLRKKNPITTPKTVSESDIAPLGYLSPSFLGRIHSTLNSALKQAVKARLISFNPCDATIRPTTTEKKHDYCSEEQLAMIIHEAAKTDLYIPLLLCALLGLRRGEALGIRWADVDFDQGLIQIRKQVTRDNLKGGLQYADLKTDLSVRTLAIDKILVAELKSHKARQAAQKLALGNVYQDEGYVCARDGGGVITPDKLSMGARRLFDSIGINHSIHLHNLRHTYATILKMRGTSVETLSDLLGHSSIKTTQDFYFRDRNKGEKVALVMESIAFKR